MAQQNGAIQCGSCGLLLTKDDHALRPDSPDWLIKVGDIPLCRWCTLDFTGPPEFSVVVFATMKAFFMQRMGFTNKKVALEKARETVLQQHFWRSHPEKEISLENLLAQMNNPQTPIEDIWMGSEISHAIQTTQTNPYQADRPDIFISHTWRGPDAELVDPLVTELRRRGYTAWYDKDKGLKPGDMIKYLTDAVNDCKNCVPIICRDYFEGHYTKFELETLFKLKDPKHIFPMWWKDIDTAYLRQQAFYGEKILTIAGVSWNDSGGEIGRIVDNLEKLILDAQEIEVYQGVKLVESEAKALQTVEKLLGEPIMVLDDPAHHFGFKAVDLHVVELHLSYTKSDLFRVPFPFPEIILKLKHLQHLSAPLINLPQQIEYLHDIRVLIFLHGGKLDILPETLNSVPQLDILDLSQNPLNNVQEGTGMNFLISWIKKKQLYLDIESIEAGIIFLIQCQLGKHPINYTNISGHITKLSIEKSPLSILTERFGMLTRLESLNLAGNNLESLPESLGNLSMLQTLNLSENKLTELPKNIGNLKNLTHFYARGNKLENLPFSIGYLKSLIYLDIGSNPLKELPTSIGNLKSLISLKIDGYLLKELPENIGNLSELIELDVSRNQIVLLPENIGQLLALKILNLRENQLFTLPESLGNLRSLTTLDLSRNKLTDLPESLGNLSSLTHLDLIGNRMTSGSPSKMAKKDGVEALSASAIKGLKILKKNHCKIDGISI